LEREVRVCLGGTFDPFHAGHQALLRVAAAGATEVFVGITDGPLAKRPDRPIAPWASRGGAVRAYLASIGFRGGLTIRPLVDGAGPAASGDYDRIVVSPETAPAAHAINRTRAAKGLPPLEVRVVPHALAEDLLPISATRVAARSIDTQGKRLTPVKVAVGSANGVKVAAVLSEFLRILPLATDVKGFPVPSGVAEQPRDDETLRGAQARAEAALAQWPEADYAIGIEAGLVRLPGEEGHLEAQACSVLDRDGWETHGWGPAFQYPGWLTERALRGAMVSDVLGPIAKDPSIGSTTGAIGWLTQGRFDRTELSRLAILMAFVPRFRRRLYTGPEPGPQARP
jgi:pantetheine-phosphate adenylyltransferase